MPGEDDIEAIEKALPGIANGAHSLDEIETWIRAQPRVRSVRLADYLLKSNPPQRDFVIEYATSDGGTAKRILNVRVLSDRKFEFSGMRDR